MLVRPNIMLIGLLGGLLVSTCIHAFLMPRSVIGKQFRSLESSFGAERQARPFPPQGLFSRSGSLAGLSNRASSSIPQRVQSASGGAGTELLVTNLPSGFGEAEVELLFGDFGISSMELVNADQMALHGSAILQVSLSNL